MKKNPKIIIGLITAIFFWASAFVAIRASLESYSPGHLALLRYLVASSFLFIIAIFKPVKLPKRRDIPAILLIGFVGITVYHVALNYGEKYISAGSASFIINSVPLFTTLMAVLLLNEKLKKWGWIGMLISFSGVTLIILGEGNELSFNFGGLFVVIAAFSQGLFFVFQKPFLRRYSALDFTAYVIWAGTLFMTFFLPGLTSTIANAAWKDTISVIYLGIFPGVMGYIIFAYVLSKSTAAKTTSFVFLVPVATILISWIWLSEVPGFVSVIGGLISVGGVYFFQNHAG